MNGIDLIAEERGEQLRKWSSEHDDDHTTGELADAACYYAASNSIYEPIDFFPDNWDIIYAKRDEKTRIQRLAIAGALIAAEIDRLIRRDTVVEEDD